MDNKIKYGLKNVHYAVVTVTSGVPAYGTPVAIPGAVNLSLNPAGDKTEFYADDMAYFVQSSNQGYSGNLEIALVPESFAIDVLAQTIDANGAYIENADAVTKDFAMLFEFTGDQSATRHVLYNCAVARPNLEGSTKGKSIEVKTESIEITASPAVDTRNVKAKMKSTDTGYSTFYTAVYLEDAITNTLAVTSGTFSKAAPADITLDATSTGTPTVKDAKIGGASIGGANITISGVDVTLESAWLATLTNGVYTITVEYSGGNAITYTLTVTA